MRKNKGLGFTLIELMIVVAILGILAAIAYPNYMNSIRKARRVDATDEMLQLANRLERCSYGQGTGGYNNAACNTPQVIPPTTDDGYYNILVVRPTNTSFLVTLTPLNDQANDADCQSFTLDQTGLKGAAPDVQGQCWAN